MQVINHIDTRLLALEAKVSGMNEAASQSKDIVPADVPTVSDEILSTLVRLDEIDGIVQENVNVHISEFDHRYELLANEIGLLKQFFMKLQAYTLDINRALVEERVQILSDIGSTPQNKPIVEATEEIVAAVDQATALQEVSQEALPAVSQEALHAVSQEVVQEEPVFDINELIARSQ